MVTAAHQMPSLMPCMGRGSKCALLAPFQKPDQRADDEQERQQRPDRAKRLVGDKTSQRVEYAGLLLRAHRNADAGGEIGMREVEARLAFERHRNGGDRDVDLALFKRVQEARKVVVEFPILEIDLELRSDLIPQARCSGRSRSRRRRAGRTAARAMCRPQAFPGWPWRRAVVPATAPSRPAACQPTARMASANHCARHRRGALSELKFHWQLS